MLRRAAHASMKDQSEPFWTDQDAANQKKQQNVRYSDGVQGINVLSGFLQYLKWPLEDIVMIPLTPLH